MVKEFMLLLALTVTDPSGEDRDEKFHVLSRHFDTKNECLEFIQSWESIIHSRGKRAVAEMLDPGWKVKIAKVGTDQVGDEAILWGKALPSEEVASHIGTIAYELVTKLTSRVAMEYVKS